jgi:phytol kinase
VPWTKPLYTNIAGAVTTLIYIKTVIAACDFLVRRALLAPSDSRKVVHICAGSWLLFWPLFDDAHWSWRLNIFVPFAFTCTLFLKGAIIRDPDDADVRTMSRTGAPFELLLGPLFFTVAMDVVGLRFFRTQVGALMMGALGIGDGLAALVGSRGTHRYQLLGRSKTLEGSAAVFVGTLLGSAFFLRAIGLPAVPLLGYVLACSLLKSPLTSSAPPPRAPTLKYACRCLAEPLVSPLSPPSLRRYPHPTSTTFSSQLRCMRRISLPCEPRIQWHG